MNNKLYLVSVVLMSVFLSACGDSTSSSGSRSVNGANADLTEINEIDDFSIYAGRYQGVIVVEYEAPIINISVSREEPAIIDIKTNGEATIRIDDYIETVNLESDRIVISRLVNASFEDVNCDGSVAINARLMSSNISGSGSGDGECSNGDISTPVKVNANISLQKQ